MNDPMNVIRAENTLIAARIAPYSQVGLHGVCVDLKHYGDSKVPLNRISLRLDYRHVYLETMRNIGDKEYNVEKISLKTGSENSVTHSKQHCKGEQTISSHLSQWYVERDQGNKTLYPVSMRVKENGQVVCNKARDQDSKNQIERTYASTYLFATQRSLKDFNSNMQDGFHIDEIDYGSLGAKCGGGNRLFQVVPYEVEVLLKSMPYLKTLKEWVDASFDTVQGCVNNGSFFLKNRSYMPKPFFGG